MEMSLVAIICRELGLEFGEEFTLKEYETERLVFENEKLYRYYAKNNTWEIAPEEIFIGILFKNYEIVKYGNEYRVICTINVDNNTFVCAPKFVYDGIELSLSGYSAKTLAEHYLEKLAMDTSVKEYKECLLDIIG